MTMVPPVGTEVFVLRAKVWMLGKAALLSELVTEAETKASSV